MHFKSGRLPCPYRADHRIIFKVANCDLERTCNNIERIGSDLIWILNDNEIGDLRTIFSSADIRLPHVGMWLSEDLRLQYQEVR